MQQIRGKSKIRVSEKFYILVEKNDFFFLTVLLRPHLLFRLPKGTFSLHRLESPYFYKVDFLPLRLSFREYCGSAKRRKSMETWEVTQDTLELILLGMNRITAHSGQKIHAESLILFQTYNFPSMVNIFPQW